MTFNGRIWFTQFLHIPVVAWKYTELLETTSESLHRYSTWYPLSGLAYMQGERALKRADLTLVYDKTQSAMVFLFDYKKIKKYLLQNFPKEVGAPQVAAYALAFNGDDYHVVLHQYLEEIAQSLHVEYKIVVDTAPVLERDLAYRAGLGWFGKNSMLINRFHGSYFLIGSILLSQKIPELSKDAPLELDHCGTCRRCIDACPTNAINEDSRTLNTNLCISTFTIETFKDVPAPMGYANTGEIFGCDICQEVCPWNVRAILKMDKEILTSVPLKLDNLISLFLKNSVGELLEKIKNFSIGEYKRFFKGTVFFRLGKRGLVKNLLRK